MQNFMIVEEDAIKLGEFLKEKRKEKDLTITDIEMKSGINRADIHRLESGQKKRLNPFQLVSLADTLEINLIDLYILVGFINKKAITDFVEKRTDERINEQLKIISYTGAIKIPVYDDFFSAFGFVKNSAPVKYTTLFLKEDSEYIGIIIKDDSLSPLISKNGIAIIEKTMEIKNGETGVFSINETFYVKKYLKNENTVVLYHNSLPSEPIIVSQNENLKFHGKLVISINEIDNL